KTRSSSPLPIVWQATWTSPPFAYRGSATWTVAQLHNIRIGPPQSTLPVWGHANGGGDTDPLNTALVTPRALTRFRALAGKWPLRRFAARVETAAIWSRPDQGRGRCN